VENIQPCCRDNTAVVSTNKLDDTFHRDSDKFLCLGVANAGTVTTVGRRVPDGIPHKEAAQVARHPY